MFDFFEATLSTVYLFVLVMVAIYGLHRYVLLALYYRYRSRRPELTACFRELPTVTIQLPMYNEPAVARRVIEAAARMDYPRDRLEIQVLDDSTDQTVQIVEATVRRLREQGVNIRHIRRPDRTGYKAGALAVGLQQASGEFICIFDADFIPPPNMLRETIHWFTDPRVAMVQARWEHLNRHESVLTRAQAVLLDGHFVIEHMARNRSRRFMNFNGTAGIWRKSAILDAGSWTHDTVTEDLDLSYRAQLRGWQFLFLPDLTAPAELPPDMRAFKSQQYRWTKGGAQTCRKLLPRVLRAPVPWWVRLEAFFHLTSCTVYLYVVLLSVLLFPALLLRIHAVPHRGWLATAFDLGLFFAATFSAATFYVVGQRVLRASWKDSLASIPLIMMLGIGISLNNARAALAGFFTRAGEFVRTPKRGSAPTPPARSRSGTHRIQPISGQVAVEYILGLYTLACLLYCATQPDLLLCVPFLALFASGYLYVAIQSTIAPVEGVAVGGARPAVAT